MDFDGLNWHDAIIKSIYIDRDNPGNNDTISIEIEWPDGVKNKILFEDIYWSKMAMNFA